MWWWEGCDTVRCGFWMNWSAEAASRSMLTLPVQWGFILVGFLALFVKLAGEHLWATLRYAMHQIKASRDTQTDMHHQIQLVLRNTEAEASFIWNLIKIGSAHRGARFEAIRRSYLLVMIATAHGVGFWVAAGLSSRFIANSDEVQIIAKDCGWIREPPLGDFRDDTIFETANALIVMARYGYRRSVAYSRSCYMQSGGNSTACSTFPRSRLPYTVAGSTPCPFDQSICKGTAITVDTGFLRSDEHLGINTRSDQAMWARKIMTCAPLEGENHTAGWVSVPMEFNITTLHMPQRVKGYHFGTVPINSSRTSISDYTFLVRDGWLQLGDRPYNLWWVSASVNYQGDQQVPFVPVPELRSPDSDLTLIALANRVGYRTPMGDPWFNARNCSVDPILGKACTTTNVLSFLGCQERYQFCTPGGKHCSALTGLYGALNETGESLTSNPTQRAVLQLYWKIMWSTQLNFQLGFVGIENLVANEYLWDGGFDFGISASLPPNHWHSEVTNWFNTTLAMMQRQVTAFARPAEFEIGPGVSSLDHIVRPEDPEMQRLCQSTKARSSKHMSFSVVGLSLTLALGLFLITSNLMMPKTVAYIQRRTGKGLHKRLEWIESSSFQLQRMAAEGRGIGPWNGRDEDVPRLVEHADAFNLTSQSLVGRWSRPECCELGQTKCHEQEDDRESFSTGTSGARHNMNGRTPSHAERTWLLGE